MPSDHWVLLPSSVPFGWHWDIPCRKGSHDREGEEVEADKVKRRKFMESDASWVSDGCGCWALSNREGFSCLHRMYVMRTRDARATLCRDTGK